jgi:murein DD-endopeptidase MepM/ murein hydrolase activator NlpD
MKRRTRVICGLLIMVLTIGTCAPISAEETKADLKAEKKRLEELKGQRNEIESQRDELKKSKEDAQAYIKAVDTQLTNLSEDIYKTKQDLDKTEKKIKKTKKKLKIAKEEIKVQYADMKLRIKYMYENGDTQIIDLFLNSEDFSDFLNKAEYITEISQYDRSMLEKLKQTKQKIYEAKEEIESDKKQLLAMQQQQKIDKEKLENLSEAKKEELKTFENLLVDNEGTADSLEDEITAQEQKVARAEQEKIAAAKREAELRARQKEKQALNEAAKDTKENSKNNGNNNKPAPSSSGFIWPLPGYYTISSDYGYRSDPFTGATSYHSGIDIPAPSGTPIVAAASGKVEWAYLSATAGNWIGINHGNGVYTVYMHMSALLVGEGTYVNQGDTIGLVGTTGSSTGNHLHLSVRQNGSYVSPWIYVSR